MFRLVLAFQSASTDEQPFRVSQLAWLTRLLLVLAVCASAGLALAAMPETNSAAALGAKYASLAERLGHNQFQRPLYLESAESSNDLKGDVYALIDYPFASVSSALSGPGQWCDVLILHINTKHCRASTEEGNTVLTVSIGKKHAQPLDKTYPIRFAHRVAAATPEYLEVQLDAQKGPLSTSDYLIRLEAVPAEGGRTFLHLTYSYAYGMAGRLAMKTYLATAGSDKVGFTIVGKQPDGQPEYIGGVRGVVERNAMRYYLAIDAYLEAFTVPPPVQLEKRLQGWFTATEQFPRQLHEVGRTAYLEMKRSEYRRQQTTQ
jgi:hypothetical protein